jgi:hypothetical protein
VPAGSTVVNDEDEVVASPAVSFAAASMLYVRP